SASAFGLRQCWGRAVLATFEDERPDSFTADHVCRASIRVSPHPVGSRTTLRNPGGPHTRRRCGRETERSFSCASPKGHERPPGGEGAAVLSSLRSNARAKNVRSQPSLGPSWRRECSQNG